MPSKKSLSDSDNESGSFADSEGELQKLQRQYRAMENERKNLYLEANETMRKQKLEIETLKKEKDDLDLVMKSLKSSTHQKKQRKHYEELKSLSNKNDDLVKAIEKEKQKQQELDEQIDEEMKKLTRIEQMKQASEEGSRKNISSQRKLKQLEDQLQLANMKFSKLLESNKELRTNIQSLRIQRQRFDDLFERIEKEKHNLQSEVTEVIKRSKLAHDERNEAQEKLSQLKDKLEKDSQRFESDMKQLKRNIEDSMKLLQFVGTIGKDREEDEEIRRLRERKEAALLEKKKLQKVDNLETYEDAWRRIKLDEENVDTIINKFLEVEEENFAMFNFVNNQSSNIEQLEEEIDDIKKKISNFEESVEQSRQQKASTEKNFEDKNKDIVDAMNLYEEKNDRIAQLLEKIRDKISTIFTAVKCRKFESSFDEGLTDRNCLKYLAVIEERTDEMVLERSFKAQKEQYDDESLAPAIPITTSIEVKAVMSDNDDDDDDDDDDDIRISLPCMREKSNQSANVHSFVSMETRVSINMDSNINNDNNNIDLPRGLDEIKSSMIHGKEGLAS